MTSTIPDEAVQAAEARIARLIRLSSTPYEVAKEALTAALPFLPVQGAVKKLEWRKGVEFGAITAHGAGVDYTIWSDFSLSISPISPREYHLARIVKAEDQEAAKTAAQADYEDRILSALEPSAARELALEALRSAEQFIENGFEFGFIRKPDEGDTALETLPKIKAAIHDLQSNAADARPPALEEGFRKGLEAACEVIDAHSEYDRQMCCDGRECGCYGATVHQSMQHYIRSLSSPDHADAGKVDGDGIERAKFYHHQWPMERLLEARRDGLVDHSGGEAWRYEYSHRDENGKYDVLYRPVKNSTIPARLPSAPSEGAE